MGATYKPGDSKKRKIEKALEDLDPNVRDSVKKILESNDGEDLEKKLTDLERYKKVRERVEKRD